jgi:hypothetical protein
VHTGALSVVVCCRAEVHLHPDISARIAALPGLNKSQLLAVWQENFSHPPPPKLRKELMVPVLAYRIQEKEFGGLSHQARKKLQDLALSASTGKRRTGVVQNGTRLVRTWRGEVHEVSVSDSGYVYRGQQYSSLSRIAREITGTQWSGPLFFGTRKKP